MIRLHNRKNNTQTYGQYAGLLLSVLFLFMVSIAASQYAFAAGINTQLPNAGGDTLKNGLVGWWTMDGANLKNNVSDISGNANNGTFLGFTATSSAVAPGKLGQSLLFDGVDDQVTIPAATSINDLANLTLSLWVKPTTNGVTRVFVAKADNTSGGHGWRFSSDNITSSAVVFAVDGFTGTDLSTISASGVLVPGQWTHLLVTWDGTNNATTGVHIYKNGIEVSYGTRTNGGAGPQSDSARSLRFGRESGTGSNYFNGALDDIRLYNRIITTQERVSIYTTGVTRANNNVASTTSSSLTSDLLGWWTFDGQTTLTGKAFDSSGNGRTSNLISIASSTFYTSGKLGQAFQFDGVDDYVSVPVASATGSLGTICAWIRPNRTDVQQAIFTSADIATAALEVRFSLNSISNLLYPIILSNTGGSPNWVRTTNTVPANRWTHVCASSNGTTYKLYINGVSETLVLGVGTNNGDWFSDVTGRDNCQIGMLTRSTGSVIPFSGKIDDVHLYSRTLSDQDIMKLYNQGNSSTANTSTVSRNISTLSSGLLGWWTMDGMDLVNNVTDKSGNSNNGAMSGFTSTTTARTSGRLGQALKFDGVDDYINIANESNFDFERTNTFSVGGWVRSSSTGNHMIVAKADHPLTLGWYLGLIAGKLRFVAISSGTQMNVETSASLNDGKWHHVFVTYRGTSLASGVTLYVDGVAQSVVANNDNLSSSILSNVSVTIGIRNGSGLPFLGSIDDVRIYNRTLSASEVRSIYNQGR